MTRRWWRAAALVVAAGSLTACAGIPTSGPIQQGQLVAGAGEDQFIRVIARPPVDGMTPDQVVQGFQEATASPDVGYGVARQYLTSSAASTWDPSAGVAIYDANGLTSTAKNGTVVQEGILTATIDASGEYTVAPADARRMWTYTLEQVGGQWRISSLPAGLVLSPGDIERGYRSFDLYYWTRDLATVVPAPVTIPISETGVATQLVRGLLAGPTPWIAPAVRTAFPDGTRLANDSVPVVDGVAQVALTREVLGADDSARQKIAAQLAWTLRQLPDVSGVLITVNGQPLVVGGSASVQPIDGWPGADPTVLSARASGYGMSRGSVVKVSIDGVLTPVAKIRPTLVLPAVSLDSTQVAGLSAGRRTLLVGKLADGPLSPVYSGDDLSRPSFDSAGNVWFVDRGTGLLVDQAGRVVSVPVGDLGEQGAGFDARSITALAVSRDGTRIALLVRRGTLVEPWVARIERNGSTVKVAAPRRVASGVLEALDLAWADADTVAVLGATAQTSLEVLELGVGTPRVRTTAAPDSRATTLAAAPDRPLLLGDGTTTWRGTSPSWTLVPGVTDAVYPG